MNKTGVTAALTEIRHSLSEADEAFSKRLVGESFDDGYYDSYIAHCIKKAFIQTLALLDKLGQARMSEEIRGLYEHANDDFTADEPGLDEPILTWSVCIRRYLDAIQLVEGLSSTSQIVRDLEPMLRACEYAISDPEAFGKAPASEKDVHCRIEAILKCVVPCVWRKDRIRKTGKSFEPDTTLPDLRTIIEYKYISSANQVGPIIDEVLADCNGYSSADWDTLFFVVYETDRFLSEENWNRTLREANVPDNVSVIVLRGGTPRP